MNEKNQENYDTFAKKLKFWKIIFLQSKFIVIQGEKKTVAIIFFSTH